MHLNTVTVYRTISSEISENINWYQYRTSGLSYNTNLSGPQAAEEAFALTNSQKECLTEAQKKLLLRVEFKGSPLSVGDVVKVQNSVTRKLPSYYLRNQGGWEEYDGNRIELLKYLD